MRQANILDNTKFIHYPAPSFWAWRYNVIYKIQRLYDCVLSVYPFEKEHFDKIDMKSYFVGHPVTDLMASYKKAQGDFKARHQIDQDAILVAMLPGSRVSELKRHWKPFIQSLISVKEKLSPSNGSEQKIQDFCVVVPVVPKLKDMIQELAKECAFKIIVLEDKEEVMSAYKETDIALVKSGTSSLELAMCAVPMVVAYKVNYLTGAILRRIVRVPYVSIINILHDTLVVPECLQENCCAKMISRELSNLLNDKEARILQKKYFAQAANMLGCTDGISSGERVSNIIVDILDL